jgi:hypothetical protein
MASFRQDVALAAARTRTLIERVPDDRDALITAWAEALDSISAAPTAKEAEQVLTGYRDSIERRLR